MAQILNAVNSPELFIKNAYAHIY